MQESDVEALGLRLSYLRQRASGRAPERTIVLLHGNSAAKEVFAPQFSYFNDSPFSLLAIDLPGHGASDNATTPEATYTIPGYAEVVGAAIDALDVGDYIVAGWSLGGHIALELAGTDLVSPKATFKGLAIFGTPPVGPGMENADKAFLPATFESATREAAPPDALIEAFVRAGFGTLDPIPEEFFRMARRTDGIARQVMVEHWMSGANGYNQAKTAATWEKPICVMHGNRDAFIALDYLKQTPWKNIWGGKVIEFAERGHAPFIEEPAAFNEILDKFASDVL